VKAGAFRSGSFFSRKTSQTQPGLVILGHPLSTVARGDLKMINHFRVVVCCSCVFLGLGIHNSTAQEALNSKSRLAKGTLSGTVADIDGKPLANVRVWTNTYGGRLLAETKTDAEGRFRLGPIEPVYRPRFDLFLDAEGFARQYVGNGTYSIFPGADCDLGIIRMDRGRVYLGQVLDTDGKPRADIVVTCTADRHELGNSIARYFSQDVKTDSNGRFRTPPMPVGGMTFSCLPPERQMATTHQMARPPLGEEVLSPLRLERDVPIHGIAIDEKGKPIAGAKFSTYASSDAVSDASGKFALRGFGSAPLFQLQGSKDGHAFVNYSVRAEGRHPMARYL
jgi:hypothetical protein